jgi:hypothetical protein
MIEMRCEDAMDRIQTVAQPGARLTAAFDHVATCAECTSALRAMNALRILRDEIVPPADELAVTRAVDRAMAHEPARRYRRGFVSGILSGAALAAAVAAVAFGLWTRTLDTDAASGVPEVRLALNEPHDVTVTLESPEPLVGADVRVELRGAVALSGYEGQRELRWSTNLDRGINQLTLPVVALAANGGQVLVEVAHGDKRRTFVLDVRARSEG